MKKATLMTCLAMLAAFTACDLRSETAKKEMEKYTSSPTPAFSPVPTPSPVDPADVANADTSQQGQTMFVDGHKQQKSVNCTKFDRIMINGDESVITIKGICQQVMVNGDRNTVNIDAAMELVFNGSENQLSYSRLVNGKQPVITENKAGNTIEKVSDATAKKISPPAKLQK